MITIKTNQINRIIKSNKDFCFFNLDKDSKVIGYKLTNDYARYRNQFDTYRVIGTIKKEKEFLTL